MPILAVLSIAREAALANSLNSLQKLLYMILTQLEVSLIICEKNFDKETLYLFRLLFSHLDNTVRRRYLTIIKKDRALLCGGLEALRKRQFLCVRAKPDILGSNAQHAT